MSGRSKAAPQLNRGQYEAADVTAYLLAGPLVFGGLGWVLDRWLGTPFLLPAGLIAGVGLALYVVMIRYGRSDLREGRPVAGSTQEEKNEETL